jgi:hypothetical protein
MKIFYDCLNSKSRELWEIIAGKPRTKPRPDVEFHVKLRESPSEIAREMKVVPGFDRSADE